MKKIAMRLMYMTQVTVTNSITLFLVRSKVFLKINLNTSQAILVFPLGFKRKKKSFETF